MSWIDVNKEKVFDNFDNFDNFDDFDELDELVYELTMEMLDKKSKNLKTIHE